MAKMTKGENARQTPKPRLATVPPRRVADARCIAAFYRTLRQEQVPDGLASEITLEWLKGRAHDFR